MSPLKGIGVNTFFVDSGSFFPIATTTVGSGGASSVTFTESGSAWSAYTHLQLRLIAQGNRATYGRDEIKMQLNSDTGSNYANHYLSGAGDTVDVGNSTSATYMTLLGLSSTNASNVFGAMVIDFLDFKNTNKYKTIRQLNGIDHNGTIAGYGGVVGLGSGLWMNTNAITSIKVEPKNGTTFSEYSHFALYGIKA
jgi:hypothetical protein